MTVSSSKGFPGQVVAGPGDDTDRRGGGAQQVAGLAAGEELLRPARDTFQQQGVDAADGLGAGPAELVTAVDQQPQRHGGVVDGHHTQVRAAQAGHGHAVGVDRVGFAALAGIEHPHPRRQLRRHVDDRLCVGDQALGDVPPDTGAPFDRPDPVRKLAAGGQHLLVAGGVRAEPALGQHPFPPVDSLDRGRPLVRIHPDHHTTHALHPPLVQRGRMRRRATLLAAGHTPLEPLPATVAGGRTPHESHTPVPWTAANESNPPATSTQPGRAEVVDQTL
jgi:hypothetical protein